MITVTSANRTAAKRLLNNWHDSREVRTMTLSQLTDCLFRAVNQNLITKEGVERALATKSERRDFKTPTGQGEGEGNKKEEDKEESKEGDESHDNESEGKDDGDGKGDDDGAEDKGESKSEGDGEGEGEEGDDDSESGEGEGEGDGEEKEGEGDGEEGEEEKEEKEEEEEEEEEDDGKPIEHPRLQTILKYIRAGLNVALVGPAGTGKSFMAAQIAEMTGRDFYVNGAMLSKYDLIGFIDAAGTYHGTPAYDAFTKGGLHCFDELDASAPDAVVAFNGMTDDQSFYTFPDGQQEQHDDYVAIACMNTFGTGATASYVGRYKQDAASMDRFVPVYIDYDQKVENRIGTKDIVARVREVRHVVDMLGIEHICSYRMIAKATKARAQKATKAEIDRDIIFARLDDATIKQVKSAMLRIRKENASKENNS